MRMRMGAGLVLGLCSACGSGPTAPPMPTRGIAFVGSDPPPGSTLITTDRRDLEVQASLVFDTAIPSAQVVMELLNAAGETCGLGQSDRFEVVPGRPVGTIVPVSFSISPCPQGAPERASRIRAKLYTVGPPNAPGAAGQWTAVDLEADLPVSYMLRRYPPAPEGGSPAAPRIDSMTFNQPSWAYPPNPGDPIIVYCVARDAEGDPLTLRLDVKWRNRPLRTTTTAFPAGASASAPGAEVSLSTTAGNPPLAQATCSATDSHGLTASRRIDIP